MTATNDLPARLREHAELHEDWFGHRDQDDEQRQWAQDLREAAAELERISEPSASHTSLCHENGAERLCRILYGRSAEIGDTIGGLDAQMLHDAAAELERMRKAVLPEDD